MAVESKPLFHPEVIRQQLRNFTLPASVDEFRPKLLQWAEKISSGQADKLKETELLPIFLTDFFNQLLGYSSPVDGADLYTISREALVKVDGQQADAVLGRFHTDKKEFIVAIEGKSTRDPLEIPFGGRKMSAVDQCYRYAINLPCDWLIVTSMRETRLYHKGSNQQTYERFDTVRMASDDALLKRFVFLLGAERVIPGKEGANCHFKDLFTKSETVGREITNKFYQFYSGLRQTVIIRLLAENASIPPQEILRCSQKLLDRILFCSFCEDRNLLPAETVRGAFEHSDPYNPRPIWDNFRGLFRSVDKGNTGLKIPAYNGGLFAYDETMDALQVPDEVCALFRDLAAYDFRPAREVAEGGETQDLRAAIDVDILGHIFEQSITDLERIRQKIEGGDSVESTEKDAKKRRKKEGAFYTPPFITRYMVEQALGSVLADRFESLRKSEVAQAVNTAVKALDDPNIYDLLELNEPQRKALIKFWEEWQECLKNIRILDPACGSGAFLIEAFDQLHTYYDVSNVRLEELRGHRSLFDPDKQILQNNLYGVDLNAEAIQICQLSLWIKTAALGKALTSLDHKIREGNSVVRDPAEHPKAFDWHGAFPEVFAQGGFDVIVGNPPYIRQEWIAPFKAFWEKRYLTYHGVADIFVYFYEQGIEMLRPGGQLTYITSGSWVRGNFGAPLRKYLSSQVRMESMIDFGEFQPFEDAELIRPTIVVLSKAASGGEMRLFKWLTSGSPPLTLTDEIARAPTVSSSKFGEDAWELEADAVLQLYDKLSANSETLKEYTGGRLLGGIKTGLNEAFVISKQQYEHFIKVDPTSEILLKRLVQGTNLRKWYVEESEKYLIALGSSTNFQWAWTGKEMDAEQVFKAEFPAIYDHLSQYRDALIKRTDQGVFWWELRSCDYWKEFDSKKIMWPDIGKSPRFSLESSGYCLGNTGYIIPKNDFFLLGILSSWTTWFFVSKTAQPLRLRGDRWQYRLIAQFMEPIPIPEATDSERKIIAELARTCSTLGEQRYQAQLKVQRRLLQSFGGNDDNTLNQKATAWWQHDLNPLGEALKQSFKFKSNPMKNPKVADDWEPYLAEKCDEQKRLTKELETAEEELNERVYRLFDLTPDEITLLKKEVEH